MVAKMLLMVTSIIPKEAIIVLMDAALRLIVANLQYKNAYSHYCAAFESL